eukprot:758609-Hanusia_phi.AAC.6
MQVSPRRHPPQAALDRDRAAPEESGPALLCLVHHLPLHQHERLPDPEQRGLRLHRLETRQALGLGRQARRHVRAQEGPVKLRKFLVREARWEALARHPDRLDHSSEPQLLHRLLLFEHVGELRRIRVDAADEMRARRVDGCHQLGQVILELRAHALPLLPLPPTALPPTPIAPFLIFRNPVENGREQLVLRRLHQLDGAARQQVLVPLAEALGRVLDVSRIVADHKRPILPLRDHQVRTFLETFLAAEPVEQDRIVSLGHPADIVQSRLKAPGVFQQGDAS